MLSLQRELRTDDDLKKEIDSAWRKSDIKDMRNFPQFRTAWIGGYRTMEINSQRFLCFCRESILQEVFVTVTNVEEGEQLLSIGFACVQCKKMALIVV